VIPWASDETCALNESKTGETPADFNSRIGRNAGVFQIAQSIPVTPYNWTTGAGGNADPLEWHIEQSGTDAAVFVTVYPSSFDIANQDLVNLGNQLKNCSFLLSLGFFFTFSSVVDTRCAPCVDTDNYNRTVFLRWAPEMQGTWNPLVYN
jgi:hypothetical protein